MTSSSSSAVFVAVLLGSTSHHAAQNRVSQVDLVQVQLNLPSKVTAGKSFIVLDEVENADNDPSPRSMTGFCLSEDDVCDEKDLRLGARRVPPLQARQTNAFQTVIKLPADTRGAGNGRFSSPSIRFPSARTNGIVVSDDWLRIAAERDPDAACRRRSARRLLVA